MEKPFALIVEDDRDIAALFRHVLDVAGYRTEIVSDGRDAMQRLQSSQPELILLDLILPGIPGETLLEWIRARESFRDVPIVIVTAHSSLTTKLPVEPELVLMKPVNLGQLSDLVQRLRNTTISLTISPWDATTHLYNREFFTIRLGYALERIQQAGNSRFGILLADLQPFDELRGRFSQREMNTLLREVAGRLKLMVRPTDTVARFDDGMFLVLIEDLPEYATPEDIAERIREDQTAFISAKPDAAGLRVAVVMLVCDRSYRDVDQILKDVDQARKRAGLPG